MALLVMTHLIILVLTVLSAALSAYPYVLLMLGGLMMILVTGGYYADRHDITRAFSVIVAVLFAFISGKPIGFCLILCIMGYKPLSVILLALLAYLAWVGCRAFWEGMTSFQLAGLLLGFLGLLGAGLLWTGVKALCLAEEKRREEESRRLKSCSLGEMHLMLKNRDLVLQNYYADRNARLIERENISRNIHNSVGHSITAAIMTLDAADMLFEKKPEEARKRMNDAAVRIRGSLEAIRSAVRALDDEDTEVSIKDMVCFFDNIIEEFTMDTDLVCDRVYELYSDTFLLPKVHVEFLTGALGEMLSNGVRHGKATRFFVKLTGDSSHIRLEVTDNGKGDFSKENAGQKIAGGFGLKKMIAYCERCGGRTAFHNEGGFCSKIELPL